MGLPIGSTIAGAHSSTVGHCVRGTALSRISALMCRLPGPLSNFACGCPKTLTGRNDKTRPPRSRQRRARRLATCVTAFCRCAVRRLPGPLLSKTRLLKTCLPCRRLRAQQCGSAAAGAVRTGCSGRRSGSYAAARPQHRHHSRRTWREIHSCCCTGTRIRTGDGACQWDSSCEDRSQQCRG